MTARLLGCQDCGAPYSARTCPCRADVSPYPFTPAGAALLDALVEAAQADAPQGVRLTRYDDTTWHVIVADTLEHLGVVAEVPGQPGAWRARNDLGALITEASDRRTAVRAVIADWDAWASARPRG